MTDAPTESAISEERLMETRILTARALANGRADFAAYSARQVQSLLALIDDLRARLAAAEGARDMAATSGAFWAKCATTATARVAELEGALEPFADAAQSFEEWRDEFGQLAAHKPDHHVVFIARWPDKNPEQERFRRITAGDFRRARALTRGSNG